MARLCGFCTVLLWAIDILEGRLRPLAANVILKIRTLSETCSLENPVTPEGLQPLLRCRPLLAGTVRGHRDMRAWLETIAA